MCINFTSTCSNLKKYLPRFKKDIKQQPLRLFVQNFIHPYLIKYRRVLMQHASLSVACHGAGSADSSFMQPHFNTSTALCPAAPTFRERKQSISLPQHCSAIRHSSPICFCNQLRGAEKMQPNCEKREAEGRMMTFIHQNVWGWDISWTDHL